jgi:hypothetical protein
MDAGLKTTAFPETNAGAIFHAGIAMGKFQGVITATTPIGSRRVYTSVDGVADGSVSPELRHPSPPW